MPDKVFFREPGTLFSERINGALCKSAPFIKYAYVYDDNGSPVKAVDVEFSA